MLSRKVSCIQTSLKQFSERSLIFSQVRTFAVTGRHSKNVAAKKNKLDAAKTKLYARLGIKILMAAKSGGTEVDKNPELARAIREAHSYKYPRENIEKAIKKANDSSTTNFETGLYEIFGHGGVGFIASTLTDNPNRAIADIRKHLRKHDVKIVNGSVLFQFDHKAVFLPQAGYDKDTILEKGIEKDIEDIEFVNHINGFVKEDEALATVDYIVTNVEQQSILHEIVEELKIPGAMRLAYIPKELVEVKGEHYDTNQEFIEVLEELDDVDTVFHNMMPSSH
eukprot:gene7761-8394_t